MKNLWNWIVARRNVRQFKAIVRKLKSFRERLEAIKAEAEGNKDFGAGLVSLAEITAEISQKNKKLGAKIGMIAASLAGDAGAHKRASDALLRLRRDLESDGVRAGEGMGAIFSIWANFYSVVGDIVRVEEIAKSF